MKPNGFSIFPILFVVITVQIIQTVPVIGKTRHASAGEINGTQIRSLDGDNWLLATDPQNVGRDEQWWQGPREDAKKVKVPGLIQETFPHYRGVVWYWKDLAVPQNPHQNGRYLIRFWEIDYLAEIWVNGKSIGSHAGAQEPFTLDATEAIRPGETNHIAVRLLHPTDAPIDGIAFAQVPHGCAMFSKVGGIMDSVELLMTPAVHIEDLYVRPDWETGKIQIQAQVQNFSSSASPVRVLFSVSPANSGDTLDVQGRQETLPAGRSVLKAELSVPNFRLWHLNDPFLYRVTAQVTVDDSSMDALSARCGFRDFRFEDGFFRLNGKRIFVKNAHHGATAPAWGLIPHDPDLLRRDLLNMKTMGFNMVRFIARMPQRYLLDLADEIGLMVYEEHYAAWQFHNSPEMPRLFDQSLSAMIRRDRNHPSIVIWGLLNETVDTNISSHATASLPLVRSLDDSRQVMLHSGRFDCQGNFTNGLQIWKAKKKTEPNIIFNPKSYAICFVPLWPAHSVSLHPGAQGEYSTLRFAAPDTGTYHIQSVFRGTAPFTTTDVHVLHNKQSVYDNYINLQARGDRCKYENQLTLQKGQTVDFVVGWGREYGYGGWLGSRWIDNTMLEVSIRSDKCEEFVAADQFSEINNPNGPWSYGYMPAGPVPDASAFTPYDTSETENIECVGGLSNPGSNDWQDLVADMHFYPRVPHRELEIARLRTISGNDHNLYLAEYGIGSGVNVSRLIRHYQRLGKEHCYDVAGIQSMESAFLHDWQRWNLDDTFAGANDFFQKSLARMAGLRKLGINALRSNPNIVGYNMTMCYDPLTAGEGVTTAFREPKPGAFDAIFDGFYPLRWCLFAEPVHIYSGDRITLEAVLSNEDQLSPGDYPARIRVVNPDNIVVFDEAMSVTIPPVKEGNVMPFAIPVFDKDVVIEGPTGRYRLLANFEKGAAATGGEIEFYVMNRADMPSVKAEVVLWSDDSELENWLKSRNIKVKPFDDKKLTNHQVILVSNQPVGGSTEEKWNKLVKTIEQGADVIFLDPDVFAKGDQPLGRLPLKNKGSVARVSEYTFPQVYPKDEWVKNHPLFDGLPAGGLMDYTFYREIIPDSRYLGQDTPEEAIAGAFRTSAGYVSELMLAVYRLGAGRIILNSLRIRQALGSDPVAERLLRNMLHYAAEELDKPPVKLPANFEEQLKILGL